MKPTDQKCSNCGKWYRGEGFEKVCTKDCFFAHEYARVHKKKRPAPANIAKKPSIDLYEKKKKTEALNQSWIARDSLEERKEARREINRRIDYELKKKAIYTDPKWMKKLNACRG